MEIAGLCLPLKPQKERGYIWVFNNLSWYANGLHTINKGGNRSDGFVRIRQASQY
jgi:hypothetical protein